MLNFQNVLLLDRFLNIFFSHKNLFQHASKEKPWHYVLHQPDQET